MPRHFLSVFLLAVLLLTQPAAAELQPRAFFVGLKDGDKIKMPAIIRFGIEGMAIKPAGTPGAHTGHFHLLIDTTLTAEEQQYAIPNDDQHLHFGKGQTETSVNFPPGPHTLQIVMGDGNHELHHPPVMSEVISVVAEP